MIVRRQTPVLYIELELFISTKHDSKFNIISSN